MARYTLPPVIAYASCDSTLPGSFNADTKRVDLPANCAFVTYQTRHTTESGHFRESSDVIRDAGGKVIAVTVTVTALSRDTSGATSWLGVELVVTVDG